MTPRHSIKQEEADHFAKQVVETLNTGHKKQQFASLMLIADPTFLGLLRQHLPGGLQKCVNFELNKNLSHQYTAADIRGYLPDHF